jgi:hypothetical protein
VTTLYYAGLLEIDQPSGAQRKTYPHAGQVVAQRDGTGAGTLTYLVGDHPGSVGTAMDANGVIVGRQDDTPWGQHRGAATIPGRS